MNSAEQPRVGLWKGILSGRCPVCRTGPVFTNGPLNARFLTIHKTCPCCGTTYEPEPGFFWGAMYFNYAFNLVMLAAVGLFLLFVVKPSSEWVYIGAMLAPVLLTIPFTARVSRMLWLYFFGSLRYDPGRGCGSR